MWVRGQGRSLASLRCDVKRRAHAAGARSCEIMCLSGQQPRCARKQALSAGSRLIVAMETATTYRGTFTGRFVCYLRSQPVCDSHTHPMPLAHQSIQIHPSIKSSVVPVLLGVLRFTLETNESCSNTALSLTPLWISWSVPLYLCGLLCKVRRSEGPSDPVRSDWDGAIKRCFDFVMPRVETGSETWVLKYDMAYESRRNVEMS